MSEKNKTNSKAMSEEMALDEFYKFISKWKRKPGDIEEVKAAFEDSIDAVQDGHLTFDDNMNPIYRLTEPVKSAESGNVVHDVMTFVTRITPNTRANLAKGIDLQKDVATYSLVVTAHVLGLATRKELDLFSKYDYDVMSQVATVFM